MPNEEKSSSMMMIVVFVLVVVVGVVAYLVFVKDDAKESVGESVTFDLVEQNDSGQNGSFTLEEVDDQVRVTISLDNPSDTEEPAHIHEGSCPTPDAVVFSLENVVDGESVTLIDSSLAELEEMGDLALNVHKSASESTVYFSCGDLTF